MISCDYVNANHVYPHDNCILNTTINRRKKKLNVNIKKHKRACCTILYGISFLIKKIKGLNKMSRILKHRCNNSLNKTLVLFTSERDQISKNNTKPLL